MDTYPMPPDMTAYNPNGPAAVFQRICYSNSAQVGYGSLGLSPGWTHNYDIAVYGPSTSGTWGTLTLDYANGAQEALTPVFSNGSPTGAFSAPIGRPYIVTGVPGPSPGQWQSVTLTWDDQTQWVFTPLTVNGVTEYALTTITNRTGQSLILTWDGRRALQTVKDAASGTALLTLSYDSNGNLSTLTDAYGRQVDYTFATDQLTGATVLTSVSQVATAPGAPSRAAYSYADVNSALLLSSVTVPSPTGNGTSTDSLSYDGSGRVIFFTDANNNTTAYTYGGGSTQVQTLNPSGSPVLTYTEGFDSMERDTGTTDAAGYSTQIAYTDANNPYRPTQVTDKLGHVTAYTYDAYGHLLTRTDPRGVVTTNTWSYSAFALGRLMGVQVGSRTPTTFTYYEPAGLVKTVTGAAPGGGSGTSTYTYDALGDVATAATPGNNAASTRTITYGYGPSPAAGEALTVTDELGHVTTYAYTARGRVQSVTDALGHETDYGYNVADQVQQAVLPATGQQGGGRVTYTASYLYPGGPLMGVTDTDEGGATVRQVAYGRGPEGELLGVTGSAEPVTYTYDALYRVSALTDGGGHTTRYFYNNLGYLSQVAYPGAGASGSPLAAGSFDTITYTSFNAAGGPLTRVDGDGTATTYTYADPCGLLTGIHYAPGAGVAALADTSYSYDGYGRRQGMIDATGSVSYGYDDTDHLLSVATTYAGLPARTIGYGYNPDGSRSSMTTPGGSFSYSYDAAGRETGLTNPAGQAFAWAYSDNDWLQTQQSGSALVAAYAFNPAGQVTDLNNRLPGGTTLSDFAVPTSGGYDGAGNRTGLAVTLPAVPGYGGTTSYQYDAKDQLTQESSTRNGGYGSAFAYDGAGNPTTFRGGSVGAASADNQLPGSAYDGDGSPTTYRGSAATYDPESRLVSLGGVTNAYTGDGLRAAKAAGGSTTYFLYDGAQPVCEMNSSGTVTAVNTFGPNGLLARGAGATGATGAAFYSWDLSGNLAQRVDAGGGVLGSVLLDGFGARASTDNSPDPFSGFGGQWGGYTDAQTGLTLFTHRFYDSGIGRFITRDPLGYAGGVNLYAYTGNDPVNETDPSGLIRYCPPTHPGTPGPAFPLPISLPPPPDYYAINWSWGPFAGQWIIDRYGDIYNGPGLGVGLPAGAVSITAGTLNQSNTPSQSDLEDWIKGVGVNVTAGAIVTFGVTGSKGVNGIETATELGLGTPQIGGSAIYTTEIIHNGSNSGPGGMGGGSGPGGSGGAGGMGGSNTSGNTTVK